MRLVLSVLLGIVALFVPLWVFAVLAVCYALWRPAYELILIGVVIDAQFNTGGPYLYTLGSSVIVLCAEFLKPHLSLYNDG